MPAIPLTATHHIVVQFLVKVIQQRYRLDNHGVNFVWTELELITRQAISDNRTLLRRVNKKKDDWFFNQKKIKKIKAADMDIKKENSIKKNQTCVLIPRP